jgi:hypothetical protein
MLCRSNRFLSSISGKPSPFIAPISAEDIGLMNPRESTEERILVLMDELTRERLLVKALRSECEELRGHLRTLDQREAELTDLNKKFEDQLKWIKSYQSRINELEVGNNQLKVDFRNYKDLIEIEKVKLNQSKSLPIILSGLAGCAGMYILLRGRKELEREQGKYIKFELDQMWSQRVRDSQNQLDEIVNENEMLINQLNELRKTNDSLSKAWVSIGGIKII